jgi:hypothetical protein
MKGTIDHHIKWESIAAKITESVFNKKEKIELMHNNIYVKKGEK